MTGKWLEGSGSRHIFAGRGREPWSTPENPGWGKWGWGAQSEVFVGPGPGRTCPGCSSSVNPTVQRHLNELINLTNRENKAGGIQQAAFLISGHSAAPAAGGDRSRPRSAPCVPRLMHSAEGPGDLEGMNCRRQAMAGELLLILRAGPGTPKDLKTV